MVPASYYLILAAILFVLGGIGVLIRRSALVMLMSVELMLAGANLTLVTYSRFLGKVDGQAFAFLVMAVAAAEVAVGLAIAVSLVRHKDTTDVDEIDPC
ncbi:MAG TPA: NADH-quinone oxidoreductase subunit NuoK [Anaerolineae bacterium]|nr:NADH-quinone oxidoreductase subunit NuoK [Anaerolineae bacterium]HNS52906.1 NADH-quinone oxidoreductase subunit NuoK [Anaerolineae bacterium]